MATKRLLIGIDGRPANEERRVGISNVCREIVREFFALETDVQFRVYLDRDPLPDFPKAPRNAEVRVLPARKMWTQRALARELRREPPDVLWSAGIQVPLRCPCPVVPTILDLAYYDFGADFPWSFRTRSRALTRMAVAFGAHFIAISEATRQDCLRRFSRPAADYTVAHLGVSPRFVPCADAERRHQVREKYRLHWPFLLYVGTLQPRKNVARLIEAFARARGRNAALQHDLVIAGGKGWMYEGIFAAAQRSPAAKYIRFLDFVPDEDLPVLMGEADALALVSLWEGFGLPVIEAMACGTPAIVSNCSSLPEIAGDAGVLVDPYDIDSIAHAIESLLLDDARRRQLREAGLRRAAQFTWWRAAETILKTLIAVAAARAT